MIEKVGYRLVPRAVFTEPALASFGRTAVEAREPGHEVKTGTSLFANNGRAKTIGSTEGKAKLVADAETGCCWAGRSSAPAPMI